MQKCPVIIAIHYTSYGAQWRDLLAERLTNCEIRLWPDWGDLAEIDYAVAWTPPDGLLRQCENLKAVFSIGAGVDQLLADPDYPRNVPLIRMTDDILAEGMAEYVTLAVLTLHRDLLRYLDFQRTADWQPLPQRYPKDHKVGIMGFGKLGQAAALALKPFGFEISGWSRTPKQLAGVESFAGLEQLPDFLAPLDFLVVLLPLTDDTQGMVNADLLSSLPRGASVINAARGGLIDIETLKPLIDGGALGHLWLDVHHVEPLPADHWTWAHPNVVVTPHIAAATLPRTASNLVADGILQMEAGQMPANVVEFDKGY